MTLNCKIEANISAPECLEDDTEILDSMPLNHLFINYRFILFPRA